MHIIQLSLRRWYTLISTLLRSPSRKIDNTQLNFRLTSRSIIAHGYTIYTSRNGPGRCLIKFHTVSELIQYERRNTLFLFFRRVYQLLALITFPLCIYNEIQFRFNFAPTRERERERLLFKSRPRSFKLNRTVLKLKRKKKEDTSNLIKIIYE